MYLTIKQQIKQLTKEEYLTLKELCHIAKNLKNEALYNIRQHFFKTGEYLKYEENYVLLKDGPNYKLLNSNMAQQILMEVDESFGSFFSLNDLAKDGKYPFDAVRLPHYLPKDGYTTLVIGFVRLNDDSLLIPYSRKFIKGHKRIRIKFPPCLKDKAVKEIRIIPKSDARYFEIQYVYETDCIDKNLDNTKALALDPGVTNLLTAVTNFGTSFIVDGKWLKSINQWANKENARLQSIADKQKLDDTKAISELWRKRNNRVNDCMNKTTRMIIDYCIKNDIGVLVFGHNKDFQRSVSLGKRNNQSFTNIPFAKLGDKLEYLCKLYGISFVAQEESYTSKASFWDKDDIPAYDNKDHKFSGRRVKRGLYRTKDGKTLNADINAALNILKKSSVVSLAALYSRGAVDTPVRIRVF